MGPANITGFLCTRCQAAVPAAFDGYICPKCGGNLDMQLDFSGVQADVIRNSRTGSLWRYAPLLPVHEPPGTGAPLHTAGWTPLYHPQMLAQAAGLETLFVKDDGRNPTASFKDRASAVVISHALEKHVRTVITASSGNAGAALAGLAAASDLEVVILVPRSAPAAKIAQLRVFGARVFLVDGTYDDAFDLSLDAAGAFGWYCRNTGYNPFTIEGKKTVSFEIWEQCGPAYFSAQRLLHIFVSVGDGNIISGVYKGFKDLLALGWIEKMPKIFGVQAEGSAAIARAFRTGTEVIQPVQAHTIADSISVGLPRDGLRGLRAATQTGGAYVTVRDEEIYQAVLQLGRNGVFAEPAGAASYAGLRVAVAQGLIAPDDPVLVLNTGNGLKDIPAAIRAAGEAPVIAPDLAALEQAIQTNY